MHSVLVCDPAEDADIAYRVADLQRLFDGLFYQSHKTRLLCGGDEPLYLPADREVPFNRILLARGYFASALHEIAHWCIAGAERRQQVDYGYWYVADGRDARQQRAFERVEARPQALEWVFTRACGRRFHVSADNLHGEAIDEHSFRGAVVAELVRYCGHGLPVRAAKFRQALCTHYGSNVQLRWADFEAEAWERLGSVEDLR